MGVDINYFTRLEKVKWDNVDSIDNVYKLGLPTHCIHKHTQNFFFIG